uniref:Uncharacterized protein n=1 Tax=Tanacetum cinerariifolium TaxID=118510 RepID=A0A6L2NWP0_TANCI|nr:hypothetical protein [Tanacetum cinerariifolium]
MEITVVTLVEEQMSSWKGPLLAFFDPSLADLELHLRVKNEFKGGSICLDSLFPSILLVVVIIVTFVIVAVILIFVVVVIIGVVLVVAIIMEVIVVMIIGVVVVVVVGGIPSIIKLSFMIIGPFSCYRSFTWSGVPIGSSGNGLLPIGRGMIHNDLSNSEKIDSSKDYSGGGIIDLTGDEDPTDEYGDTEMDDSTGVLASLGGDISLGGRKSQESNSDNTGGITVEFHPTLTIGMQLCLSFLASRSIISTGSSTKLSLSLSQISFIGMTRDSSDRHFFKSEMWKIFSRGWSFASVVLDQMTHIVASLTLDSVKSCMIQGASCSQKRVSMVPFVFSIPFVLSWDDSISLDSFLPSILLVVVIVITVVIVAVILIFVVVVIVRVVLAITIIGVAIVVMIIGVVVVVIVPVFSMEAACASRAAATLSAISYLMAA